MTAIGLRKFRLVSLYCLKDLIMAFVVGNTGLKIILRIICREDQYIYWP